MTRVLLQLVEGGFAAVFRQSGDKGGQKNGDGNAGGFEPVEMAEEKDDVDGEGRQQDFDNRIAEAGQKLPEETVALFLRQLIAAMLLPGTLALRRRSALFAMGSRLHSPIPLLRNFPAGSVVRPFVHLYSERVDNMTCPTGSGRIRWGGDAGGLVSGCLR